MNTPEFEQRLARIKTWMQTLWVHRDLMVEAIVQDGWPEAMVQQGLALHKRTWDVDALATLLHQETALGDPTRHWLGAPPQVVHIWPALPGAGLAPVLMGMLAGVPQLVVPSSRGRAFGAHLARASAQQGLEPLLRVVDDSEGAAAHIAQADAVVVSGSDETLAHVRQRLKRGATLVGYGHKVSVAVVVDHDALDLEQVCDSLSLDIVMWHQRGCFSVQDVVFCGAPERADALCAQLGRAIERTERRLGATFDEAMLAKRAQARGVAAFAGQLHGEGLGWVAPTGAPLTGEHPSAHVVGVHRIDDLGQLGDALALPRGHRQGVALSVSSGQLEPWSRALAGMGFTRISSPGLMQSPGPHWFHDGRANVLPWMTWCTLEL